MAGSEARLPRHVGIIPDGNRRWARKHGVPLEDAYRRGYERLREVLYYLLDVGVRAVSVYAMSWDNYSKRSPAEVSVILALAKKGFRELAEDDKLRRRGIRVRVIGRRDPLPFDVLEAVKNLEESTESRRGGSLYIAFLYSSRWEVEESLRRGSRPETLLMEPVELVVRTGGARRLSDFFPLATVYAELYFTETLWPDFSVDEMKKALRWFAGVERRFGR